MRQINLTTLFPQAKHHTGFAFEYSSEDERPIKKSALGCAVAQQKIEIAKGKGKKVEEAPRKRPLPEEIRTVAEGSTEVGGSLIGREEMPSKRRKLDCAEVNTQSSIKTQDTDVKMSPQASEMSSEVPTVVEKKKSQGEKQLRFPKLSANTLKQISRARLLNTIKKVELPVI